MLFMTIFWCHTLIGASDKVIANIITNWFKQNISFSICLWTIFTLRLNIEKVEAWYRTVFLNFIDLKKHSWEDIDSICIGSSLETCRHWPLTYQLHETGFVRYLTFISYCSVYDLLFCQFSFYRRNWTVMPKVGSRMSVPFCESIDMWSGTTQACWNFSFL